MKTISLLLGIVGVLFSCSPSTNTSTSQKSEAAKMTVEIDHFLQACTGEGPILCERYRKEGEEAWQFSYDGIQGLEFKWGIRQTIEMECETEDMNACKQIKVLKEEEMSTEAEFQLVIMDETGEPYLYSKSDGEGSWTYFGSIGALVEGDELKAKINALSAQDGTAKMGTFTYNSDRTQLVLKSIP